MYQFQKKHTNDLFHDIEEELNKVVRIVLALLIITFYTTILLSFFQNYVLFLDKSDKNYLYNMLICQVQIAIVTIICSNLSLDRLASDVLNLKVINKFTKQNIIWSKLYSVFFTSYFFLGNFFLLSVLTFFLARVNLDYPIYVFLIAVVSSLICIFVPLFGGISLLSNKYLFYILCCTFFIALKPRILLVEDNLNVVVLSDVILNEVFFQILNNQINIFRIVSKKELVFLCCFILLYVALYCPQKWIKGLCNTSIIDKYFSYVFLDNLYSRHVLYSLNLVFIVTIVSIYLFDLQLLSEHFLVFYILFAHELIDLSLNSFGLLQNSIDHILNSSKTIKYFLIRHNIAYSIIIFIVLIPVFIYAILYSTVFIHNAIFFYLIMIAIHCIIGNFTSCYYGCYSDRSTTKEIINGSSLIIQIIATILTVLLCYISIRFGLKFKSILLIILIICYFAGIKVLSKSKELLFRRRFKFVIRY